MWYPILRSSILMFLSSSLIAVFAETLTLNSIGIGADAPRPVVGTEAPPPPRRPPRPPPRVPPPPPPPLRPAPTPLASPVLLNCSMLYDAASLIVINLFVTSILLISPTVRNLGSVEPLSSAQLIEHNNVTAKKLDHRFIDNT